MPQSISTVDNLQFIDLQPNEINPLMTNCKIKVLYVGENRNGSVISKEVAINMSKTLRGCPIVGHYIEQKQDFGSHDKRVVIENNEILFEALTTPYGFVPTDAEVWFEDFEEIDAKTGNPVTREYLLTTGFLWAGQFKECQEILNNSKGQSMELDPDSLEGYWTKAINGNYDIFIINDATFLKLCILGDDVEPCFEGANISTYSKVEPDFTKTLFSMVEDLKNLAKYENKEPEGRGNILENTINITEPVTPVESVPASSTTINTQGPESVFSTAIEVEPMVPEAEFSKLQNDYNELKNSYDALKSDYDNLVEFKLQVENEKKDELINSFYMLSDEDKKDVIENKSKYSYDEIEAKLSVICVHKKVNFAKEEEAKPTNPVITYSVNSDGLESGPAWLTSLRNTKKERNEY